MKVENIVIIGSGISGLTAAIYIARANLEPVLLAGPQAGGQLTLTTEVENFPGFEHGIDGNLLMDTCKKQALRFGTRYQEGWVKSIERKDDFFQINIVDKDPIAAKAIVVATGASARWLDIPSEAPYKGKGISTCATCDGFFFKDKELLVIGGGDSAMEEATFLTKFASKVTIVHRRDTFRASKIMADRALKNPKIEVIYNAQIDEIMGDGKIVTGAKLKDTKTGEIKEVACGGIFLAIGHIPNTKFLKGLVDLDEHGYVLTNERLQTNVPGIFASGDVQDTVYRQAITAAGTGCQAALEAERYVESLED